MAGSVFLRIAMAGNPRIVASFTRQTKKARPRGAKTDSKGLCSYGEAFTDIEDKAVSNGHKPARGMGLTRYHAKRSHCRSSIKMDNARFAG